MVEKLAYVVWFKMFANQLIDVVKALGVSIELKNVLNQRHVQYRAGVLNNFGIYLSIKLRHEFDLFCVERRILEYCDGILIGAGLGSVVVDIELNGPLIVRQF